MDELEARLDSLLSDPSEMEKLKNLASSLFGQDGAADAAPAAAAAPSGESDTTPDTGILRRLQSMMGAAEQDQGKAALVRALSPYLRPERAVKLQKALKMAQAARVARLALGEERNGGI
ncbi:MAG: hypothetical protein LUE95_04435 [Oscillospiraceae bacterium]|nr:hypothetical protein [Oscillospiraceae bacterium]